MKKLYHLFLFIVQYCYYYLITPIAFVLYGKKKPWLICERGDDARDNGYFFFKYIHDEQINFINAYYLINKKSADYKKLNSLGETVRYKSIKHWLLYRVSECRMSTHLSAFAPGNFIGEYFKHHKQKGINVFLQHGITHNEFPSNYYKYNGSDLFICGAKPEYNYISKNCNYPKGNVVYTGFARFDKLHNYETKNQILLMPTWRSYLSKISKEDFKNSTYHLAIDHFLRSPKLNSLLKSNNLKLVFYIHYSLQPYIDCFSNYGSNIIVADFDHYDVQTLLKESKLLITDYSSIFFDFAYMRKPLIYYQFDVDDFYSNHYKRSYFSHSKDGFGKIVKNKNDLISEIEKIIRKNYIIDKQILDRIDNFFPLDDTCNSRRIFCEIINKLTAIKQIKKKAAKPTYLTFTADDYGRNSESTIGINEAFNKGYIQQTSLMINRSKEDHKFIDVVPKTNIVYHFNITEGYQSFDDISKYAYSVNADTMARRINNKKTFFKINKEDLIVINKELTCQLDKYKQMGYEYIAFDSHGHMHNRLPIAKLLIPECKKRGFKVARIPMNIKHNHLLFDLTYRNYIIHLYRKNFTTTDYFCSCYQLIHLNLNKYKGKTIEIMTHPFMFENGLANRRDIDFDILRKYISKFNVKLINYNDLIKMKEKKHGWY